MRRLKEKARALIQNKKGPSNLKKIFTVGILALFGFAAFILLFIFTLIQDLPSPEALGARQIIESTKIYDREGETLIHELFDEERRTIIPFEEISQSIKDATIATEDNNFYIHKAVDLKAILRAALANLKAGGVSQGGSTITQQLAKNAFLSAERTFSRKAKELVLAFRLEGQFTKDEILGLYLNQIPYGSNAYGIESAAKTYFKKTSQELSLAEVALLTSLPKAPSYYSPWGTHIDELLRRKNSVLDKMESLGFISEEEKTEAQNQQLIFEAPDNSIKAPHFSIAVQEYLNEKFGEDFVRRAGLKVITTLDWELQEIAERVVKEGVERNTDLYGGTNGALIAQDTDTGQILAMVGSVDYFNVEAEGNFNVATLGLRQPGSATKPFTYLTAFKKGFTPETVIFDVLTEFDNTNTRSYMPRNFDHKFRGPVNMRTALAQSMNIVAVKTLYMAGIGNVIQTLTDFGITTLTEPGRYGLSLVLGGGEVTLQELVGAYATLAEEGVYNPQTLILRIEDRNGKVLEEFEEQPERVMAPEYPRIINDILTDTEARRGLFLNSIGLTIFPGHDVALKTGTSNDYRDVWSFGYTPNFAVGIWTGNNDNTPMTQSGGYVFSAVPMWSAFLSEALQTREREVFARAAQDLAEKPVLRGQHIVIYEDDEKIYPQTHTILFYVDKNNPRGPEPRGASDVQFQRWENSVLEWSHENIAGFDREGLYNQPIPNNAVISANQPKEGEEIFGGGSQELQFINPKSGANIKAEELEVEVQISISEEIEQIKLYFNNKLMDEIEKDLPGDHVYKTTIKLDTENIKEQNELRIRVKDAERDFYREKIILFANQEG